MSLLFNVVFFAGVIYSGTHKNCLRIILEIPNPTDYMNIVSYYAGDCILKILFSSYRNLLIIQSVHHITFFFCVILFMDFSWIT